MQEALYKYINLLPVCLGVHQAVSAPGAFLSE